MKVRMKVAVSGSRDGNTWPPIGGETELPDQEGIELCRAGLAEPVRDDKVETAKAPEDDVEQRTPARRGRPRKQPATEAEQADED